MDTPSETSDLLYGLEHIADYLRLTPRQAKHLLAAGRIPSFKVGRTVCARRSTLTAWLAAQEAGLKN